MTVKFDVHAFRERNQIAGLVIAPVSIDVMDDLIPTQVSAMRALPDDAVLKSVTAALSEMVFGADKDEPVVPGALASSFPAECTPPTLGMAMEVSLGESEVLLPLRARPCRDLGFPPAAAGTEARCLEARRWAYAPLHVCNLIALPGTARSWT